jgi:hypothetical protein
MAILTERKNSAVIAVEEKNVTKRTGAVLLSIPESGYDFL